MESNLLCLGFLIRYERGDNSEEVVDVTLNLLVPVEGKGMQSDVLIERFERDVQDTLENGVLEVQRRGLQEDVHDLLLLG